MKKNLYLLLTLVLGLLVFNTTVLAQSLNTDDITIYADEEEVIHDSEIQERLDREHEETLSIEKIDDYETEVFLEEETNLIESRGIQPFWLVGVHNREKEPNNAYNSATDLGDNRQITMKGQINYKGDLDWFKLRSKKGVELITIELNNLYKSACDFDVELYDENLRLLGRSQKGGVLAEKIEAVGDSSVYYIKVYSYNGYFANNEYDLSWLKQPAKSYIYGTKYSKTDNFIFSPLDSTGTAMKIGALLRSIGYSSSYERNASAADAIRNANSGIMEFFVFIGHGREGVIQFESYDDYYTSLVSDNYNADWYISDINWKNTKVALFFSCLSAKAPTEVEGKSLIDDVVSRGAKFAFGWNGVTNIYGNQIFAEKFFDYASMGYTLSSAAASAYNDTPFIYVLPKYSYAGDGNIAIPLYINNITTMFKPI